MFGKGLNRIKELGSVQVEGDHRTGSDNLTQEGGIFDHTTAAEIQQTQHTADVQHIHHGAEDTKDKHSLILCLFQIFAALTECFHLLCLTVEDLGDLDAGQVLGQEGIQLRTGVGNCPVGLTGELLEDVCEQCHKGYKAQHHQSHRIVNKEHGYQNTCNNHDVLDEGHQNVGKEATDAIGIVGDTGHQFAHRDIIELFVAQTLNMAKDVLTQVGQDLLTDLLQDHCLQVHTDHRDHHDHSVSTHHGKEFV